MEMKLATAILVFAAAAGAAWAAGPGMGTAETVRSPDGKLVYRALANHKKTTVRIVRAGRTIRTAVLPGYYGAPVPTNDGTAEGVSHDGQTLVLASSPGRFAVLDAHTLRVRSKLSLPG